MTKKITLKKLKEIGVKATRYLDIINKEICFITPPKKLKWFVLQDIYDIRQVMLYFEWIPTIHKLDNNRLNREIRKVISIMENFDTTAREELIPMWAWKFVEDGHISYEIN